MNNQHITITEEEGVQNETPPVEMDEKLKDSLKNSIPANTRNSSVPVEVGGKIQGGQKVKTHNLKNLEQASQGASKSNEKVGNENIFDSLKQPAPAPVPAQEKAKPRRTRKIPMIDFDEQDAYMKQIQAQKDVKASEDAKTAAEGAPIKDAKKGKVIGNYVLGRDLGKGTFGEVMVGTHSLTGEKVAIKVLEKDKIVDVHDVERVAREIHILKIVRHPTIVQLYEIIETSKELYLIMEYARGGELFEYIVNRKRVREKDACKFLHQILSGVDYLHKLGICHRDLKPENLLMDDFNNIKIVDFGLSNTYKKGESLQTACGSPCYAAPEMVAGKKYDGLAADMWSCGVIIYAMVCGFLPFEDPKTNKLYQKILNAEYSIPDFVSESCQNLIRKVLLTDPNQRLSIEGIRAHPWYQQVKVREYKGIYVGIDPIPVDMNMISKINDYDTVEEAQAKKYVSNNRHNSTTTIYYLILKKHLRKGGESIADITKYNPQDFKPEIVPKPIAIHQKSNFRAEASLNSKNILSNQTVNESFDKTKGKLASQIKIKNVSSSNHSQFLPLKQDTGDSKEHLQQKSRINIEQINTQYHSSEAIIDEEDAVPHRPHQASKSPDPRSYFEQSTKQPLFVPIKKPNQTQNQFQIQGQGGAETSIDFTKRKQMQSQNPKNKQHHRYSSQPAVEQYLNEYQENDQMQLFMLMQQEQYESQKNYQKNGKSQKPNNVQNKFANQANYIYPTNFDENKKRGGESLILRQLMMMQNMQNNNNKIQSKAKTNNMNILAKSNRAANMSSMGMTSDFQNHDNFNAKIPSKTTRRQIHFNSTNRQAVNNTQLNFYHAPPTNGRNPNLPNVNDQAISQNLIASQNISAISRISNVSAMSHQMPSSIRYPDLVNSYNDAANQQNAAFKRFKEQTAKTGNSSSKVQNRQAGVKYESLKYESMNQSYEFGLNDNDYNSPQMIKTALQPITRKSQQNSIQNTIMRPQQKRADTRLSQTHNKKLDSIGQIIASNKQQAKNRQSQRI